MGFNTLMMMVLPSDERILKDIRLYLKTDKYIKQSQSTSNKDSVKRLLYEKGNQNSERRRSLILLLRKSLGEAAVYLNGSRHEMGVAADGKTKVVNAFQDLVKIAYPNLRMLGAVSYSEETVKNTIRSKQDDLFGKDETTMSEAENEILNFINRRKRQSDRTSLTDIKDYFSRKPYGWYPNAIWTIVARLYKRGKVEVKQDSNLLSDESVLTALMNNRVQANTLLEPQVEIDPKVVKALKEVYNEMFDVACPASEAKEVALAFKSKLEEELSFVRDLLAQRGRYSFTTALEPVKETLEKLYRKEPNYYLLNLKDFEDKLLDAKEDLLDPIKRFWNSEQKKIYDDIRVFLEGDQSNFEYIEGDELELLREVYHHPKPYSGTAIRDAKAAMLSLQEKVLTKLDEEKAKAKENIHKHLENLKANADFQQLDASQQKNVLRPFEAQLEKIDHNRYISNIRHVAREANNLLVEQLNAVQALQAQDADGGAQEPKVHYIRRSNVIVRLNKAELQTEQDVEEYVSKLREEMLRHIHQNTRITL